MYQHVINNDAENDPDIEQRQEITGLADNNMDDTETEHTGATTGTQITL